MVITYHGENSFRLQAGETVVLVDPENQRSFKGAHCIIATARPSHIDPPLPTGQAGATGDGAPFWIDHQGEYDLGSVTIHGVTAEWNRDDEHTAYRVTMDDVSVGLLGFLTAEPKPAVHELLAGVDILIMPAGGKPFLTTAAAAKLARQLEPSIVIPSLTDPKPLVKELGNGGAAEDRLTVKKKDLAPKAVRVVVLTS